MCPDEEIAKSSADALLVVINQILDFSKIEAGKLELESIDFDLRTVLEDSGLPVDEGALYPLLRRLEAQGLLTSQWREEGRSKRFYRLSPEGEAILARLHSEWASIGASLNRLLAKEGSNEPR